MEWRKHGEPESLEIQEGDLRTLPSRLRTLPSREYGAGLAWPMPCIAGAVVINELDAHGVPQDWVELKNIGAVNCTLQGWYLSD
eukprot:jgi/Chrpa1/1572/Chrysochromulina_OHIO_Genome00012437-RA